MPGFKKRRLHGEMVQQRGTLCTDIPKIGAMLVQLGNTHNKCVHDSLGLANSSPNPCLMWLHYI